MTRVTKNALSGRSATRNWVHFRYIVPSRPRHAICFQEVMMSTAGCGRLCTTRGFTLIELLVVVGIVAILASIAIPQYGLYRKKGSDATMEAALNSARIAMEAYYESNDYSYIGADVAALEAKGYRETENVTLEITPQATEYSLRACYGGGSHPSFVFVSDIGKILGDSSGCS